MLFRHARWSVICEFKANNENLSCLRSSSLYLFHWCKCFPILHPRTYQVCHGNFNHLFSLVYYLCSIPLKCSWIEGWDGWGQNYTYSYYVQNLTSLFMCLSVPCFLVFFFSRSWNGGYLEMSQYFCVVKMFFFFFFLIACMLLCVCVWSLSHAQLFATLWTVACQAPLSMQFLKNTGVGCHCFLQGIFPTQGSKQHFLHCTAFLALQENSLPTEPLGKHSMLMTSGIIQMWNQVRIFINNF